MGPNSSNALFFLVGTLFDLYMWILILRVILQGVRADFYNPISQLIWQVTQPIVRPVQTVVPKFRWFDTAAGLLLLTISLIYIQVICAITDRPYPIFASIQFALLKLVVLTLNLYTFALFVQAVLSWVGPGVNNPAGNLLWVMNEPLLKPVRRVLPPLSGLDLSPLLVILALQFLNLLIPLPGEFR